MKITLLLALLLPFYIQAQHPAAFEVESLKRPEKLLEVVPYDSILKRMLHSDPERWQDSPAIIAKSPAPGEMVDFGGHAFFNGMYQAYADHRPFILSPDMIWLLISQGFARHVNSHSEEMRKLFVDFDGKLTLIVKNQKIRLADPNSPWQEVFPDFVRQISRYTGDSTMRLLSSDFSTTTPVTAAASQITVMEAMKPYFDFVVLYVVCGIPEITLEGTPADWEKLLAKAQQLRKYGLDWWIDAMEPLLQQFIAASKDEVDTDFWQQMFKYHTVKKYGVPGVIDGWIVKFFPYDKQGRRNDLKELTRAGTLPDEMVKVDVQYVQTDGINATTTPLEVWAGFTGLTQNKETFALRPEIGWMVRKKAGQTSALKDKLNKNAGAGGIHIRVKEIPVELFSFKEIQDLQVDFIENIIIPEAMSAMKIGKLILTGKITETGIQELRARFPATSFVINGKSYEPLQKTGSSS